MSTAATDKIEQLAEVVATDVANLEDGISTTTNTKLDSIISLLSGQAGTSGAASPTAGSTTTTRAVVVVANPDRGMSEDNGQMLNKYQHIRQSLMNIFTTPIGSRVMRRAYGSQIPALVDAPLNESTMLRIVHAAAEAALKWEPRISKLLVVIPEVVAGKLTLGIAAEDEDGNVIKFEEVTV